MVGQSKPINDAVRKVTGRKSYVADMKLPGLLYAKLLLSPVAHAYIKYIDTSQAEALPGVRAVVTYRNAPSKTYNSAKRFIEQKVICNEQIFSRTLRFVGDRVAAVAADTEEIATEAIRLIKVEYSPLPIITSISQALEPDAYPIHEGGNRAGKISFEAGKVDQALSSCDYVLRRTYTTPAIHHLALEPHVVIADWQPDDRLTIIAPCQNTFAFRLIIADLFDLPYSKVRLSSPAIGGAFGGKLEVCVEPVAALLSKLAGQPVKLELTRRETIIATRVRHASENHLCTGFSNDGTIQAIDCLMYTNTGAYASSAMNVAGALSHKLLLPYTVRNVRITVIPVYTNTIIAGAMRGYGSPQLFFGLERQIEEIAHILGVDNTEIQLKNMVDPDSLNSLSGEPIGNPRPKDCLVKAMELMDYQAVKEEEQKSKEEPGRYAIGVGVALGVHGNNCFGVHRDNTTPMIRMNEDGSCTLVTGAHDMGNDVLGMQMQIISDVIGVSMDKISVVAADTDTCLWHIGDYSSRGVFVIGSAAKNTAEKLRRELQIEAGKLLDTDPEMIELHDDAAWVKGNTGCTVSLRDVMTNCQAVSGRELCVYETYEAPRGAASYGVHMAKVSIDRETGKVSILSYVAVHDVGFIINPMMLEGQLEGGIHMGLGYGLSEKITFDEQGKPSPLVLKRYGVLRATDMPSHLKVGFVADKGGEPGGPYGAKAMGECPVVPVAPAVVNAIRNALDMEINDLPADKEKILQVLHQQAGRG